MFKKPRSRLAPRGREKSPEDISQTTSEKGESVEESPIALASRLKNKAKRTKPKSTLSFGGDEEVHVFTPYTIEFSLITSSGRRWGSLPSEEIKS